MQYRHFIKIMFDNARGRVCMLCLQNNGYSAAVEWPLVGLVSSLPTVFTATITRVLAHRFVRCRFLMDQDINRVFYALLVCSSIASLYLINNIIIIGESLIVRATKQLNLLTY